jgi:hypothetical protein
MGFNIKIKEGWGDRIILKSSADTWSTRRWTCSDEDSRSRIVGTWTHTFPFLSVA